MAIATFGAGCFWGVEEIFRTKKGVQETAVGYMGGSTESPTYKEVCTDKTGHVEVVHITYDPAVIEYDSLLKIFFENHDPTQVNRQGPDFGKQYRTVIFYHDDVQKEAANAKKATLDASGKFSKPIATAIEPAVTFWPAEEYHQKYLLRRGLTVCHI